ncbi:MAG TPA: carboxypeptidase-like regulatory domain-containing protein [Terriglobia bacterium]|nr:carboxypeptidase-like regulatory domain-containing protein [Terriglobia bacterium]
MKRVILSVTSFLVFVSLTAWAQDTASIVGTVSDNTGAVIPAAKVTVANSDKGFTRYLVSDAAGIYSVSAVPIGNYVITAEAPGFQKLVQSGITLTVGQTQRVDLRLQIGAISQEVTVTGNVTKVQTENATLSDVVTGTQIEDLELNGRNFVSLALLVPGAVPNGLMTTTVGVYANNSISFNGGRTTNNNWEIDGGSNTDEGSSSTFNTYPNLDSIAEFRISTSNYSATMGKHAGAQIEVATKSGTKDFHGDMFVYNRNNAFAANDWFLNQVNQPISYLNQNEFGYTLGGPVVIPGHYNTNRSKTFFFWSEDWRRIRQSSVLTGTVPSAQMRAGDFSQCDPALNPGGNLLITDGCILPQLNGVTYDTVQSMPGFDQQAYTNAVDLLNAFVPLQNTPELGYWATAAPSPTNWRQEQIRVDQNISDKTQIFFRYTQDAWNTITPTSLWTYGSYDTVKTSFVGPGKSMVAHITHSFSPTFMNEFIASYTVDHIDNIFFASADSVAGSLDRPSNFAMNHLYTANDSDPTLPLLDVCGGTNFCMGEDPSYHYLNASPVIYWKDNVAWTHGKHTTRWGFMLENFRKRQPFGTDPEGQLWFNAGGTLTTGNSLADMFLGRIQSYTEGTATADNQPVGGFGYGHWRMYDLEPYIEDDWKASRKLTFNFGLRYYDFTRMNDFSTPPVVADFVPNEYNPADEDPLNASGNINTALGLHTYTEVGNGLVLCGRHDPPCQLNNSGKNFAPRIGFAWDPWGTGKTSIRGGWGLFFESSNGNESNAEGTAGDPPAVLTSSGYNILGFTNIIPGALGTPSVSNFPHNEGWPYVENYNLSVQHQFSSNDLMTVAYVGSSGRKLYYGRNLSMIPLGVKTVNVPALAGQSFTDKSGLGLNPSCDASGNCNVQALMINEDEPSNFFQDYAPYSVWSSEYSAVSSYNALQTSFRHSLSHGLTLQAAYTWAHAIDNDSTGIGDYQQISRWKGTSYLHATNVLVFNYVYGIPLFTHASNAFVRNGLGGWKVSGITTFSSGSPFTPGCGVNGFASGIGEGMACNEVAPMRVRKTVAFNPGYGNMLRWWDPNTVTQPQASQLLANNEPGMFGNLGESVLDGPGRNNWDMGVFKDFSLPWFRGEHSTLEFRLEGFNAFNHVQWAGVNNYCNGDTPFGVSCGATQYGNASNGFVNSDNGPRVVQFGLKLKF